MTDPRYTDYSMQRILDLCRIPSPSGYTKEAIAYLQKELESLGYQPYTTNKNALICDLGGE
ncbi:MAG: hypothetical protein U1C33_04275, partial [Candidatus Cloacimonadaceae bacterium]|nr:hypothetical protein [Candidatus Cloacimonadaceae bacterium]